MAKLPSFEDLGAMPSANTGRGRASINPSTPNFRAAVPRGGERIGEGVANLGKQVASLGARLADFNDRADEFETERRFQEFKWNQTQALDTSMREAEPGQTGNFAETWTGSYNENAKAFFESVPEHLKPKYDAKLFDTEREFYGSAATFARTEQKRSSIQSLDEHKNRLATTGDIDKAKKDYDELVTANPYLTPIEKDEVRRKGLGDLEEGYIKWRLERGDDLDDLIKDLETPPAPESAQSLGPDDDLEFIRKQEGFTPRAKWDFRQHSNGYGTKAASPGEVISKEEAERRLQAEAGAVSQWIDANITVPLTQNQRKALVSFGFNLGTDDLEKLKDDINAGKTDRVADRMVSFNRAGGERLPGLVKRRRDEAALFLKADAPVKVAQADSGTRTDASGATLPTDGKSAPVSRYQYLPVETRARLLDAAKRVNETNRQSRLWDYKQQMEDDVESIRATGEPRQGIETEAIQKTVEPSVWNNYVNRRREAEMEYVGGRDLPAMTDDQMRTHLDGLVPEPGVADYGMRASVYDKVKKKADAIRALRAEDPAESVKDSVEVQRVAKRLNETGVTDPGALVKARLEAQTRLGIPAHDRSPITRAEAKALLDLPDRRWNLNEGDYLRRLKAAADRAEQDYGPLLAADVFRAAVGLDLKDKTGSDAAAGIMSKMVKNQAVTADDFRRMTELQNIDQIGRVFDATAPQVSEDRPTISPMMFQDRSAEFKAKASAQPNAAQQQWIRDNPDQWQVFDIKFGRGAAARVLGQKPKA